METEIVLQESAHVSWADEVSEVVAKRATKAVRKAAKEERKRLRLSGALPTAPCPECGENHWKMDCPKRIERKKAEKSLEKKISKEPEASDAMIVVQSSQKEKTTKKRKQRPKSSEDLASEKPTKRAKEGENRAPKLTEGLVLVAVIPKPAQGLNRFEFLDIVCAAITNTAERPVGCGTLGHNFWVEFESPEAAENARKFEFVVPKGTQGCRKNMPFRMNPYVAKGPRAFHTREARNVSGPEIQAAINAQYPTKRYWLGQGMKYGIRTDQRLVIFEEPTTFNSFQIKVADSRIPFWAVALSGKCDICEESHSTTACGLVSTAPTNPALGNILTDKP